MIIAVFRHGEAEEKKPSLPDELRRLTDKGRQDVELVARALPWRPSIVYTSPLLRAVETAKIIGGVYGVEVVVTEALRPESTSIDSIKSLELKDLAILVGHAPSIEKLVSELIGGGNIKLEAGAVACIELSDVCKGCGTLILLVTPRAIRKAMNRSV